MSTEVQKSGANLPAPVYTPAPLDLGSDDIALPRIYIGQHMSSLVQEGLVKFGDVFSATGKDDTQPEVLWSLKSTKPGPLFHVLSVTRRKSASVNGELETFEFNDPDAPADAWTTYNYLVVLPEVDQDVPYKLLLTKTGAPAAKALNTILKRNEVRVPPHALAFRLTSVAKENAKGKFAVARIVQEDADEANVAIAAQLGQQIGNSLDRAPAPSRLDEPAI